MTKARERPSSSARAASAQLAEKYRGKKKIAAEMEELAEGQPMVKGHLGNLKERYGTYERRARRRAAKG